MIEPWHRVVPTPPRSVTPTAVVSERARRLAAAAAEAAQVRGWQTDPDVVGLWVERARTQVEVMVWAGIVLGLLFTMVNVQQFAAAGSAVWSLGWWTAWLLDPMVSLVLLALLRAEQVTSRYRVTLHPWVSGARRFCLAATYGMNCWAAWAALDARLVILHSVPPLLVFAAAEAVAQARVGITEAVDVAVREHRERDVAQPETSSSAEQVAQPSDDEVREISEAAGTPVRRETELMTALYQLYDEEGTLIYVGVTGDLAARMAYHRRKKGWWPEVADTVVRNYPTRLQALAVEEHIIETDRPRHNVNKGTLTDAVTYGPEGADADLLEQLHAWVEEKGGEVPSREQVRVKYGIGASRADRLRTAVRTSSDRSDPQRALAGPADAVDPLLSVVQGLADRLGARPSRRAVSELTGAGSGRADRLRNAVTVPDRAPVNGHDVLTDQPGGVG